LINALLNLYPDVDFDTLQFSLANRQKFYDKEENRKRFFDNFANAKGFDPLNPLNWYPIEKDMISETKGGKFVLEHYEGSLYKSLSSLYPDIGLKKARFGSL